MKIYKGKTAVSTAVLALAMVSVADIASANSLEVSGYVRQQLSFNLEDPPETSEDDKWDASMIRTTVRLDFDGEVGPIGYHFVTRAEREYDTNYLERLDDLRGTDNLVDHYNNEEIREAVLEFSPTKNVSMRFGKQQVAWGETDFFTGLDIIHGFDYSWRSFLEVENEELRKPLIMLNTIIQVPSLRGALQLLVRPGWDEDEDIGTTYDLFGGRWANQPNKGVDFLDGFGIKYNYDHKEGDTDDVTYGARWSGVWGDYNYSVAYLTGFNTDPVVNSVFNPYKGEIKGGFAEFIYPEVETVGLTLSTYSEVTDAVWSAEFAFTKDKPYNIGSNFFLPGFLGVEEKDVLRSMIRMDKQMDLSGVIGTSRPSLVSVQIFDTWLTDFDTRDDIVDLAGYAAKKKEHSTIITLLMLNYYNNDRIKPELAAGYDLSYGGGFVIPSLNLAYGDHWRVRVEADIFFDDGDTSPSGNGSNDTNLFGYFANNDQLSVRLTYQF